MSNSELRCHAEDYLRLRRSLGFKLRLHGPLLAQFMDYLEAADATTLTTDLAVSFAQLPQASSRSCGHTGSAWYAASPGTCRAIDPATEIPPMTSSQLVTSDRHRTCWQETEVLDLIGGSPPAAPAAVRADLRDLLRALCVHRA